MGTPILVVRVVSDDLLQSAAPTYAQLQSAFDLALSRAKIGEDPTKVTGLQWMGPGPRVTRKVRENVVSPGGTTTGVAVLQTNGTGTLAEMASPDQYTRFVGNLQYQLRSALAASLGGVVSVDARTFDPSVNGPDTFWSGSAASTTHTRDRFPTTNALGAPSTDQNENAIGPSNPALVPVDAPPVIPPNTLPHLPDVTALLTVLGVGAAGLAALWLLWPVLAGTRRVEQAVLQPRQPAWNAPRVNPYDPKAKQQIVIAYVEEGLEPDPSRPYRRDLGERPHMMPARVAKTIMWARKGTLEDLHKAVEWVKSSQAPAGALIYTYPTSERDPLGKSKTKVLQETAPRRNPSGHPALAGLPGCRVRSNPVEPSAWKTGHARIQRLMKAHVLTQNQGTRIYVYNSALPMPGGGWSYYSKSIHGDDPRRHTISHADLVRSSVS